VLRTEPSEPQHLPLGIEEMGSTTAHFFLARDEMREAEELAAPVAKSKSAKAKFEDLAEPATAAADSESAEESAAADSKLARSAGLFALVERSLAGLGYELVDLERAGRGLLRVTLDRPLAQASAGIGIEDCERVSRHLTHLFAVEEVDYERLEVSSPGMDRPLRGARDFARFAGELAKVQLQTAEGRKRLRGRLLGMVPADSEGVERVRLMLLPGPAAPAAKGERRMKAKKVLQAETIEFALAEVEKARLAPEWEFERNAVAASAGVVAQRSGKDGV
jgi:ribosome maturation factor RimP